MAAHADPDAPGVELIHEDDGSITATDVEPGVASFGETKSEALAMLAEALALHEGGVAPVEDEDAVLRDLGLDPGEIAVAREENDEHPEFLR